MDKIKGFRVTVATWSGFKLYWVYSVTDKTVSVIDVDMTLKRYDLKDGTLRSNKDVMVGDTKSGSYIPEDVLKWIKENYFKDFKCGLRAVDIKNSLDIEGLEALLKPNIICSIEHMQKEQEADYVIKV